MKYFVFVSVSLFLFYSAVFAQSPEEGGMQDMPRRQMMQQGKQQRNPEEVVEKQVEMLTKRFNLTADQQAKAKDILTASAAEAKKIMQEAKQKIRELIENDRQKLDVLLTEEQRNAAKEQSQSGGQRMPPMQEGMSQEAVY